MFYPATPRHSVGPNSLTPPFVEQPLHPQSLTPGQPPMQRRPSSQPQYPAQQQTTPRPPPTVSATFQNHHRSVLICFDCRPLQERPNHILREIASFLRKKTSDVCFRSAKWDEETQIYCPRLSHTRSQRTSRARISSRLVVNARIFFLPNDSSSSVLGVLCSLPSFSRAHFRTNSMGVCPSRPLT